jgi:hypothetical protein
MPGVSLFVCCTSRWTKAPVCNTSTNGIRCYIRYDISASIGLSHHHTGSAARLTARSLRRCHPAGAACIVSATIPLVNVRVVTQDAGATRCSTSSS